MQTFEAEDFLAAIFAAGIPAKLNDKELGLLADAFQIVPLVKSENLKIATVCMKMPHLRKRLRVLTDGSEAFRRLPDLAKYIIPKDRRMPFAHGRSDEGSLKEGVEANIDYLLTVENWLLRELPSSPLFLLDSEVKIVAYKRAMLHDVPEAREILREREPVAALATQLERQMGNDVIIQRVRNELRNLFGVWVDDRPEVFDAYRGLRNHYLSWPDDFVVAVRKVLVDYLEEPRLRPFLNDSIA